MRQRCSAPKLSRKAERHIPAAILRERLPETLAFVEERELSIYHSSKQEMEEVKQTYRDFVKLCERKERETGEAVHITASY